jgi:hypothetical protein
MGALDYALRDDNRSTASYCFAMECPEHVLGDEARLDFAASGWDADCSNPRCTGKPVWRIAFLCESMPLVTEHYCDRDLPERLRRVTRG